MTPAEFDYLSWREMMLVLRSHSDTEVENWRRAVTVATAIFNESPRRPRRHIPKQPDQLYPGLYPKSPASFQDKMDAAIEQEEAYMAAVRKKEERLARQAKEKSED